MEADQITENPFKSIDANLIRKSKDYVRPEIKSLNFRVNNITFFALGLPPSKV